MTKLIIFDLDGVLVEAKQIHYDTLNQALEEIEKITNKQYVITEAEHLSTYDGLKTTQKLELLTKNKGLHPEFYDNIWYRKQHLTTEAISQLQPDLQKIELFKELRNRGYKLAVASNSIRRSVLIMLAKIGIIEYMDLF
jgi:beta-phosphoglucomutase-like phosphatase (HAD superfamily)